MNLLFGFLFVSSVVALGGALVKPAWFPPFLRIKKRALLAFGGAGVIFLILNVIAMPHRAGQHNIQKTLEVRSSPTPAHYVFEVLSLVGKYIDEVRIVLGKPVNQQLEPSEKQLKQGVHEWQNTYTRERRKLVVSFDPMTRAVLNLFVGTAKGDTKELLLKLCDLSEKDSRYKLQFLQSLKGSSDLMGVLITAQ